MDNQKKQVVDKLKAAKNVLVTVSNNPSVDQLAACLGLTLMLNKLGKHASAVFSGDIPPVLDFLKPEETIETNTNSLRDFIIALDKGKADKLRYKVEDRVVRIFITPYKTSISQDDLEFSEGDFNVDVVVALGVREQQDIDQAVTAHGNILHDATVITVTTSEESDLGSLHWRDPSASGVSELAASLSDSFDKNVLDEQIATAFLTGIVAQTERFSNNLTASSTMSISAKLMGAGANQQLVATELETPPEPEPIDNQPDEVDRSPADDTAEKSNNDGALEIDHSQADTDVPAEEPRLNDQPLPPLGDSPEPTHESGESTVDSDSESSVSDPSTGETGSDGPEGTTPSRGLILEGKGPDTGQLTANIEEEQLEPSTDALNLPPVTQPILSHDKGESLKSKFGKKAAKIFQSPKGSDTEEVGSEAQAPSEPEDKSSGIDYESLASEPTNEPAGSDQPSATPTPESAPISPPSKPQTLDDIENSVHSSHQNQAPAQPTMPDTSSNVLSPDSADHIPSVSVDQNGQLIHEDLGASPDSSQNFQPAPGFGAPSPAMSMPNPSLKPLPDQPQQNDSDNPPPPTPPPIV